MKRLMTTRNANRAVIVLLAVGSLAASCGSDPEPAPETETAAPTPATSPAPRAVPTPAAPPAIGALVALDGRVQLLPGMGAGYLKIRNDTNTEQRLIGAATPIAASVSIHETLIEEGVVRMKDRDEGFPISVGGELVLEPGGKHLMLHGLDASGDPTTVTFTLSFADHPSIELEAWVIGAKPKRPDSAEPGT